MIEQVLWWIPFLAILLTYANSIRLSLPRPGQEYVSRAAGARLVLGIIEVALVVAALVLYQTAGKDWYLIAPVSPLDATPGSPPADPSEVLAPRSEGRVILIVIGALLAWAGAALAAWSKIRLGRFFTIHLGVKEGHVLVTDGPYAMVRHPIYLGLGLFVLGSALLFNSVVLVGLALALLLVLRIQARIEERAFAAYFGADYVEYRRRVPALLPWPRPGTARKAAP